MSEQIVFRRSFLAKTNDVACRGILYRGVRFLRARLYRLCRNGELLSAEPSVLGAWKHGWDAEHYIRLLRWRDGGYCPKVIFDVGAHAGSWSWMCAEIFSPEEIVLFEPQPELQAKIKALRQRVKLSTVWKVMPFALGRRNELLAFHQTRNAAASSFLEPMAEDDDRWGIDVVDSKALEVKALDDLVAGGQCRRPDLVKIDVQGFEAEVLEGGRETISQAAKIVIEVSLREIYAKQPLVFEVLKILSELGFQLEDIVESCRKWPSGELWQVDLWLGRASRA